MPVDVGLVTPGGLDDVADTPVATRAAESIATTAAASATVQATSTSESTLTDAPTSVVPVTQLASATSPAASPTASPSETPSPTAPPRIGEIPSGAQFSQQFIVSADGDFPVGVPADLRDGRDITWASLRNGSGAWIFDLNESENVAGVRFIAHRDGDQDTTLLGIDVSSDGASWTPVYAADGACGDVAGCEVVAQRTQVDYAVGPVKARFVRLRGGPTRFAIAEMQIALLP